MDIGFLCSAVFRLFETRYDRMTEQNGARLFSDTHCWKAAAVLRRREQKNLPDRSTETFFFCGKNQACPSVRSFLRSLSHGSRPLASRLAVFPRRGRSHTRRTPCVGHSSTAASQSGQKSTRVGKRSRGRKDQALETDRSDPHLHRSQHNQHSNDNAQSRRQPVVVVPAAAAPCHSKPALCRSSSLAAGTTKTKSGVRATRG